MTFFIYFNWLVNNENGWWWWRQGRCCKLNKLFFLFPRFLFAHLFSSIPLDDNAYNVAGDTIQLQVPDRSLVASCPGSRRMTSTSDEVREFVLRSNHQRQQVVAQKLMMMLHQSNFGSHTSLRSIEPGNMRQHKIKIRSADYGL